LCGEWLVFAGWFLFGNTVYPESSLSVGLAAPAHLGNCSCVALPPAIHGGRNARGIRISLYIKTDLQAWFILNQIGLKTHLQAWCDGGRF
jgi:hypothetical protein